MQVVEINNIKREESYIYYRRNFTAVAKLDILSKYYDTKISFTIEANPLGIKSVELKIDPNVDFNYPMMPIMSSLKKTIMQMDNDGLIENS